MKKAEFKYEGNPTGHKVEVIYGTVILKDDGKVSIQGVRKDRFSTKSYAAHYQAGELAKAIVKADFNHPAVTKLIESNSSKGLVAALYRETAELKTEYIAKCKEWEAENFDRTEKWLKKVKKMVDDKGFHSKEWFDHYKIECEMKTQYGRTGWFATGGDWSENKKSEYQARNRETKAADYIREGKAANVAKAEKHAIDHYNNSIAKLAYRLNQKGVTDDSKFTVTSARVKMNFECYIHHDGGVTKAWTIIASGPIQRPHYRYLVK